MDVQTVEGDDAGGGVVVGPAAGDTRVISVVVVAAAAAVTDVGTWNWIGSFKLVCPKFVN